MSAMKLARQDVVMSTAMQAWQGGVKSLIFSSLTNQTTIRVLSFDIVSDDVTGGVNSNDQIGYEAMHNQK